MSSKKRRKSTLSAGKKRGTKVPGTPPGTAEHVGKQRVQDVKVMLCDYDSSYLEIRSIEQIEKSRPLPGRSFKTWINVQGLHDIAKLQRIWSYFELHPLIREDIVNTHQRPKMEVYNNCLFFVLKMFTYCDKNHELQSEQINIILGTSHVLSFQETDRDYFKPVADRLSVKDSRIRREGADYLAYALIDTVVDHYFKVIQQIDNEIEEVEDRLFEDEDDDLLQQVHEIRRKVVQFRKAIWPLRDVLHTTIRDESDFVTDNTKLFLRDVYDHMVQMIENIESFREAVLSLHDLYRSKMSNRMNEIMKVLTIIATIFIPLTFIAGIYGMNFNPAASPYNMPELNLYWGYPVSLIIMAVTAAVMIFYFKRKDWL